MYALSFSKLPSFGAALLAVLMAHSAAAQDSRRLNLDRPIALPRALGLDAAAGDATTVAPDLQRLLPPVRDEAGGIERRLRSAPNVDVRTLDQGLSLWARGNRSISDDALRDATGRMGGSAEGIFRRGLVTELVDGDAAAAVEIYRRAADAGAPEAAVLAGRARLYGIGGRRDTAEAQVYLSQALGAADPAVRTSAALELGNAFRIGLLDQGGADRAREYLTLAATNDVEAAPLLVDYLVNDEGRTLADPAVVAAVTHAAGEGNVSALYQTYQTARTDGERSDVFSRIKASSAVTAGRYIGDIANAEGNVQTAFDAYRSAATVDPYALAQSGILALDNPDLDLGLSTAQAMGALRDAAELGAPNAYVALAQRTDDPDQQYLYALNGMASDPEGRYQDDFDNILEGTCAHDADQCRPTPVWYVTNRVPDADGRGYENRKDDTLHVGVTNTVIRTQLDPDAPPRTLTEDALCTLPLTNCAMERGLSISNPETNPQNAAPDVFLADLKREAEANGIADAVVFIHGFNNSFDEAAARLALLANRSRVKAVPILLSWASGAETVLHWNTGSEIQLAYSHDKVMADASCVAFLGILRQIGDAFGADHVQVVAHSMGGYLFDLMSGGCGDPSQALGPFGLANLILAAPDIDAVRFDGHYSSFRSVSDHLTLYVSANDVALKISTEVMNPGEPRLGQGGQGRFVRADAMTVDTTPLESSDESDWINHKNVFDVPEARRDIGLLLNGFVSDQIPRCLEPIAAGQTGYFLTRSGC